MPLLPTENLRSPAALARFALVTLAGLALDLWSKSFAFATLSQLPNEQYRFSGDWAWLAPWLQFDLVRNPGVIFGLGEGYRSVFLAVSVAAILFLTYLFAHSGRQRFYQIILGMLLAGVLGNMYDRIVYGSVRDMFHIVPGKRWTDFLPDWGYAWQDRWVFPWVFNVADVLLCVGVFLMIAYSLFFAPRPQPAPAPAAGDEPPAGGAERIEDRG